MGEKSTQWPISDQIQSTATETGSSPVRHDYDYAVDDLVALRGGEVDSPPPF